MFDVEMIAMESGRALWREADWQLRRIAKARARLDAEEAPWLLVAFREQVHAKLGFGSFAEYLERAVGYQRHTAIEKLRVAEKLAELPAVSAALARGDVCYSAARELARVATAETEADWLDAIEAKTVREIEEMVAGREVGDRPDAPPSFRLEPIDLRLRLAPEIYGLFLEARRALEAEAHERIGDDDLIEALCMQFLRSRRADPADDPDANPSQTAVDPSGPSAVDLCDTPAADPSRTAAHVGRAPYQISLSVCPRCDRARQDAGGRIVDVAPSVLERARCDADHIGHVDADPPERLTSDIPPATRRLVLARDHHRCRVPGCRNTHELDLHHLKERAAGGSHAPANLIVLCGTHHRAVHDSLLRITGPHDQLRFSHSDGRTYGADFFAEAKHALRQLGFPATTAAAAVDRVAAHVGRDTELVDVIRAALRECPRPVTS